MIFRECFSDFPEEIFVVSVAVGHSLDYFDLVIDALTAVPCSLYYEESACLFGIIKKDGFE